MCTSALSNGRKMDIVFHMRLDKSAELAEGIFCAYFWLRLYLFYLDCLYVLDFGCCTRDGKKQA